MKKNFLIAILALTSVLFAASCSKSDNAPPPPGGTSPQGKWIGGHDNGIGGPVLYFELNLNANSVIEVRANSNVSPDIANGTWSWVADSVRATYTYVGSSTTYSLAGKYSTSSKIMNGTIGLGTNTAGAGVFSVTKQ
jgi:hypothetical protein